VAAGGKGIVDDWQSQNSNPIAPFGATFTGNVNWNPMNVTDPTLSAGITNPVGFHNPGYANFSMGLIGSSIAATFPSSGEGAIVEGNNGRSIVNGFLSDTFASGAQGVQLYTNEIMALTPATTTPEPSTMMVATLGAFGMLVVAQRCRGPKP
jgi:hypothetical protein